MVGGVLTRRHYYITGVRRVATDGVGLEGEGHNGVVRGESLEVRWVWL